MSKLPESERRRRKVFTAESAEELSRIYDEWADRYDADIRDDLGFAGPERAATILGEYVPTEARILDAGAGTGLVGAALQRLGYTDLHGLDASEAMLAQARAKGVYRTYHKDFLGESVALESQSYDAVISVGTLTSGHVEPHVLPEFIRIVRAPGHIVFTLVPDFGRCSGYFKEMERLERCGAWQKLYRSETFATFAERPESSDYNVWVYAVR